MTIMPKKIEPEVRERALRLLETHGGEYPSLTAACQAIAKQVGVWFPRNRGGFPMPLPAWTWIP
ncbi:hypothetical protein JCM12141A_01070 [Mycolicibacterium hodleri]